MIDRPGETHKLIAFEAASTRKSDILVETMAAACAAQRRFDAQGVPYKAFGWFEPEPPAKAATVIPVTDDTRAKINRRIAMLRHRLTKAGISIPEYLQPVTS